VDSTILLWIHHHGTPLLDGLFRFSHELGTVEFCSVLVVAAALWHAARRQWPEALAWVAAGLTTLVLTVAIKLAVERPRPTLWPWMQSVSGFSFPSGHAMVSAAFFPLLGWLATRARRGALGYAIGLLVAAYVGVGRLYLGVHWPSDVLAGWALGLAQSGTAIWWLSRPARPSGGS
jgi:membrane-associated phospholipid phosphatase